MIALPMTESFASWWLDNPFEKYATLKLDHFPEDRGEKTNIWVATI